MNNSVAMNGIASTAVVHADKREMQALVKLLKKYNLKKTADTFCQETNLRTETLDDINEKDVTSVLNAMLLDNHDLENGTAATGNTGIGTEPAMFEAAYANLRGFVDESLDIYKHELSLVLYPMLVQIYFKLVEGGYTKQARQIVEKYGPELNSFYYPDLKNLLFITKSSEVKQSEIAIAMELDKFVIRMSRDAYSLLKRHIQDRKQEVIADIVAKYLHFDTYEGTARSKAQCDATSGAAIGEAKRQDNKIRVYYGLLKEVDFQTLTAVPATEEDDENDPDAPDKPKKKKPKKDPLFSKKSKSDPNAPSIDRIPLPEMKDSDKMEKMKAIRESAKRVTLGKDNLPSICMYTLLNSHNTVICAEVAEDSSLLAIGFSTSIIKVFALTAAKLREMKSAEQLKEFDKDVDDVLVRMMDEKSSEQSRTFIGHSGPVYKCSFSPERNMLLSCSEDSTIRLWSLHTWTCIVVYKGHVFPVWDVRFSPHGYYFASASYDKTVRLWVTDSNQPIRIFCGHLADVDCVQFHPNSNYVASGSSDRTVRLWDVLTGQLVRLMTGHKGSVYALAFSICGRYLSSGSSDQSVIIWDISNGQMVTKLLRHTGGVHSLTFSRDGNILATGALDCLLAMWDFSKLIEDHMNHNSNASHNTDSDTDCGDKYLLQVFPTKITPFMALHFTRRNLLLGVGMFKSQS